MIEAIIEPRLCQIASEECDWKQAIRIASAPQLHYGYIMESYVRSMIQNVEKYGPYIVIAKDIAIAHAAPDDSCRRTSLGITRFLHPVDFHSPEFGTVQLVFSLAAPDGAEHMQLLQELVHGIDTPQKVTCLEECRTPDELYRIFLQNTEAENGNH